MKRMVKGVEMLFNLAYMVCEGETDQARLHNAADKAFHALDYMVDYLVENKESAHVENTVSICSGKGCCNHLQCNKDGRRIAP